MMMEIVDMIIEELKHIEVQPDSFLSEAEKNHFRCGADAMRAALLAALRSIAPTASETRRVELGE